MIPNLVWRYLRYAIRTPYFLFFFNLPRYVKIKISSDFFVNNLFNEMAFFGFDSIEQNEKLSFKQNLLHNDSLIFNLILNCFQHDIIILILGNI